MAEHDAKMERVYAEQLEMTPAAERAIDIAINRRVTVPILPPAVGALVGTPTTPIVKLTAIGGLPEVVRQRFDIPWSTADDAAYRTMAKTIRNAGRLLPDAVLAQIMERIHKQVGSATYLTSVDHHSSETAP